MIYVLSETSTNQTDCWTIQTENGAVRTKRSLCYVRDIQEWFFRMGFWVFWSKNPLWSDPCQEKVFSPDKVYIFSCLTASVRSSDLTVYGIGHSVIRGLVTNRLMVSPRVLLSMFVDHKKCAYLGFTQMTQTFQWSQPPADAVIL